MSDIWSAHSADRSKRVTFIFLGGSKARGGTRWYGGYLRSAASWTVYGICTTWRRTNKIETLANHDTELSQSRNAPRAAPRCIESLSLFVYSPILVGGQVRRLSCQGFSEGESHMACSLGVSANRRSSN
jgi:hypothetical protein